jgi:hypothetical protein
MNRKTKIENNHFPPPNKETLLRTAIKSKQLSDDENSQKIPRVSLDYETSSEGDAECLYCKTYQFQQ